MQGVVNERGASKKGTPKLKIDGTWYVASRLNLDGISPGSRVEFVPSSFAGQDGSEIKCINSIRPVAPSTNGYGPSPAKVNPAVSDDAEMRFISNCVGQAIAAGTIKEPHEIAKWFASAKAALKAPTAGDFEEDVPFDDIDAGRF
jgi:hypothetical protein